MRPKYLKGKGGATGGGAFYTVFLIGIDAATGGVANKLTVLAEKSLADNTNAIESSSGKA